MKRCQTRDKKSHAKKPWDTMKYNQMILQDKISQNSGGSIPAGPTKTPPKPLVLRHNLSHDSDSASRMVSMGCKQCVPRDSSPRRVFTSEPWPGIWAAWDDVLGADDSPYGYGATEDEAVADLLDGMENSHD